MSYGEEMRTLRKNKYKARRCRCLAGHIHDSKGEAGYCDGLFFQIKSGDLCEYEVQKKFELHGKDGKWVANHYVDFYLTDFDGNHEIHEYKSKGTVTPLWKLKKALVEHEYPNIPYTVIWHKSTRW